jgi:probable HAF family extracellular repeat protein
MREVPEVARAAAPALAFAAALLGFLARPALAVTYTLTDLGTTATTVFSEGQAIDGANVIAGTAYTATSVNFAFVDAGSGLVLLPTLGGRSDARAINSTGVIAGDATTAVPIGSGIQEVVNEPVIWNSTGIHKLGTLGTGLGGAAYAINDAGKVVGVADTTFSTTPGGSPNHAFLYDGTMHDLGTLGGRNSLAAAINTTGEVAGQSAVASGATHAFLYSSGVMHDLGTLGGTTSAAEGLNAAGEVVGQATVASGKTHAFLYDGTMHDLGTLGGTQSFAYAINDAGEVVGFSYLAGDTSFHAFLYANGVMQDLGSLGGNSGAYAINSAGDVTGFAYVGTHFHAILGTPDVVVVPAPEPSALPALAGALTLMLARALPRRRRR